MSWASFPKVRARRARFQEPCDPDSVSIRRERAGGDENLLAFERRIPALQSN
jgi:hypothetical protein